RCQPDRRRNDAGNRTDRRQERAALSAAELNGAPADGRPILAVEGLTVAYDDGQGAENVVVRDVAFELFPGRIHGLAGESGCGKSTAVLAGIGFPIAHSRRLRGRASFYGVDLFTLLP